MCALLLSYSQCVYVWFYLYACLCVCVDGNLSHTMLISMYLVVVFILTVEAFCTICLMLLRQALGKEQIKQAPKPAVHKHDSHNMSSQHSKQHMIHV